MQEITPGTEERIPGNPGARLKLVLLILGAIALYFFWEPVLDFLTPLEDESAPNQEQLQALRLRFIVIFGFSVAFSLLCAYGSFRMALRIRRSGQFPAPGTSLPFSTVVKRGKEAHNMSVGLLFLTGMGVLSAGASLWALSVMLDLLSPVG